MSSATAKIKCPELRFVYPRFDVYQSVSYKIRKIFFEYTNLVEPLSLDEAFLDVTVNKKNIQSATMVAREIKQKILEKTGLTASAGISINKFLAKLASDYQKPNGLFVIKPEDAEKFVEGLPVEKFYGVGKVTSRKMHQMGIIKGIDLKRFDVQELVRKFGKVGAFYYDMARAIDTRPVEPERIRKSVGAERTFDTDLVKMYEIQKELLEIEKMLIERLIKTGFTGRTLTLKVNFDNFQQVTRSRSFHTPVRHSMIHQISVELASGVNYANHGVRLLGLAISNLREKQQSEQLSLDF